MIMRIRLFVIAALFSIVANVIATDDSGAKKNSITVVSYNIKHGHGMDNKVDLVRTAEVIKKLNPDLVALQEVDKSCSRSGNVDQAAALGKSLGMQHAFGKFMDFQGGEYGLAVLSRYPIIKAIRHQLPAGGEPRCALEVIVQPDKSKKPISFICIHNDWTKEDLRVPQVKALLKGLRKRKNPVMLVGDFNTGRDSESFGLLKKAGFVPDDKGGKLTAPSVNPRVEIDHILLKRFKANAKVDVIEETVASDHRPLKTVLSLPEDPILKITIDASGKPELAEWLEDARENCLKHYGLMIEALRNDAGVNLPEQINLKYVKGKPGVPGFRAGKNICISVGWIEKHPGDKGLVIHELAHVAQSYPSYKPPWLVEGIADYIRFWTYEQENRRPRLRNPKKQKYTDSYQTTAAFLAWVEKKHPGAVRKLSISLINNAYEESYIII